MKHLLLSAILFLSVLPAEAIIWRYGEFKSSKKECTLTGWGGTQPTSGKLTVPSSYKHTDGVTYTVKRIAAHALDNLTTVTEITIPASVTKIGNAATNTHPCDPNNFANCPALKKFKVESGSKYFSAIDDMLYVDGEILIAVPSALAVSGGSLTLPAVTAYISSDAFAGNTTITKLTLPRSCSISGNGGLNRAKAIKKYALTGSGSTLKLKDGMLIHADNWLASYPPAGTASSLTIPGDVETISEYAFANTSAVKTIDLANVTTIWNRAFEGSGLTEVTLPGTVKKLAEGTFAQSQGLQSIHFESVNLELPDHFAEGCTALTRVTSENPLGILGEASFKKCSSLKEFPFSCQTDISADSIFYGCGFTRVVFSDDEMKGWGAGNYMFAACPELEEIDASAVRTTEDDPFTLPSNFATNSLRLKTLRLPAATSFLNEWPSTPPTFGYSCALGLIDMHTVWAGDNVPRFCYSTLKDMQEFTPTVYVAVTANRDVMPETYNSWPVGPMFTAGNGATVRPRFFCDAYTPSEDYVCSTASYYVPGGTLENYSDARIAGCTIRENFGVEFQKVGDWMQVSVTQNPGGAADVRNFFASFNGGERKRIGLEGNAYSDIRYDEVKEVRLTYLLDNREMATDYPKSHWSGSSIDDIADDAADFQIEGRTISGGDDCVAITVYNLVGQEVGHGDGPKAHLDALAPGVYFARLAYANGKSREAKFTLD